MSAFQNIGSGGSIKEQIYWEKLHQLQNQWDTILNGTHPEYVQGIAAIEEQFQKRLLFNDLCYATRTKRVETERNNEKTLALREFEEKKSDVKECLISELEEKKRQIEQEYLALDLTGDGTEAKQPLKRNLRRRFNDPAPFNDKKPRKASPTLNCLLLEVEIEEDMKKIYAATGLAEGHVPSTSGNNKRHEKPASSATGFEISASISLPSSNSAPSSYNRGDYMESNLEMEQILPQNGKLLYQKKWYLRGQPVTLETSEIGKVNAIIQSIGHREIGFRIVGENKRITIPLSQLQQGKCTLKKR